VKTVNKNMYDIPSIKRVTRTFLEVSRCSRAKNGKEMYKKKNCVKRAKLFFFPVIPIVVFLLFSLPALIKRMLFGTNRNDDF